jgi:diguanylate cyclase (GGDEF)-like protein/PAS domain S-box-containing protein
MLGYRVEDLLEKSFIDITHPEDIGDSTDLMQQLVAGAIGSYRIEKRYVRKDASTLWAYLSVALKRSPSGAPEYLIAVIEDLSALKEAEAILVSAKTTLETQVAEQTQKLHASNNTLRVQVKKLLESEASVRRVEHRLRSIANSLPALVGYWNRSLECEFANETYGAWFGVPTAKIPGMKMQDLLGETLFQAAEPHVREALKGQHQRFERQMTKPTGGEVYVDVRYMPDFSDAGQVKGFFVLVTDVTTSRNVQRALEEANLKLAKDSTTDYLTGIAHRRVFSERSEEASRRAKTHDERYGLILLDLDNFKQINDAFGHDAGDEVLRCVGKLLKGQLRSHRDVAARLGGEEFGMLCFGHLDEELLVQVAERIRSLINKESIRHEKGILQFAGSFGLGLSSPGDADWKSIYSRADAALYQAKKAGKDRVVFGTVAGTGATGRFRSLRLVNSI